MELKVLGTVSPTCYENKNCPGYLISKGNKKLLLDCGNGICRYLKTQEDLPNMTIILSHVHKDHYGDILSLAYSSYVLHNLGLLEKRVPVYIPEPDFEEKIELLVDEKSGGLYIRTIEKALIDYEYLTNLGEESFLEFITYNENTKLEIGNIKIDFSPNPHQIKAYSIRVKDDETTLVYSGDTGYENNTLTKFAKEADLLICESTFLKGQTRKKDYHLYASEAGKIAKEAGVTHLLLTHFYPEIDKELYVSEAKEIFENTTAAAEGKVLKLGGIK